MANRKISDLTALTAPATGDLLPIVDISEAAAADKNKKITVGTLLSGAPLGSAAAASFAFSGYPGTGIYSPGADQLALSTGGTGRVFVTSTGIGIGTSSPVGSLHSVAAATNAALSLQTPSTGNTRLAHLYGGNSYSYGVVGIVAGNGTFTGDVYGLGSSSNPTGSFSPTLVWTTSAGQNVPGRVGIGTTSPGGTVDIQAAASTAPLIIQGPSSEFARIDSSGRLLVGTSSDSGGALFQVNGDRIRIGTAKTPASASATGTTGEICWDANYIYVCTATNTWKRTAISTW